MLKFLLLTNSAPIRDRFYTIFQDCSKASLFVCRDINKALKVLKTIKVDIVFADFDMTKNNEEAISSGGGGSFIIALANSADEHTEHAFDFILKTATEDFIKKKIKYYVDFIYSKNTLNLVRGSVNLFSKYVFSQKTLFIVQKESDLIVFFDFFIYKNLSDENLKIIRNIYYYCNTLLKNKVSYEIFVEEDNEFFYISIVAMDALSFTFDTNLLKIDSSIVKTNKNICSISISKKYEIFNKQEEDRCETPAATLNDIDKNILRRATSTNDLSAEEFTSDMDDITLVALEKIEIIEVTLYDMLLEYQSTLDFHIVYDISSEFLKYATQLDSIYEFKNISYAITKLSTSLKEADERLFTKENSSLLANMLIALLNDLINWRQTIFINKSAQNIHYLDSSLLSSCIHIEEILKGNNIAGEDDIEFF